MSKHLRHLLLMLFDFQATVFAIFAVSLFSSDAIKAEGLVPFLIIPFFYLSNLSLGLYEAKLRESYRGVLRRLTISAIVTLFICQVSLYALSINATLAVWVPVLFLSTLVQWVFRYWFFYSDGIALSKRTVLVIGANDKAEFIAHRMRRASDRKNLSKIVFWGVDGVSSHLKDKEYVIFNCDQVDDVISKISPDIIVIAINHVSKEISKKLIEIKAEGTEIILIEDFIEAELGQIPVDIMSDSWLMSSDGFKTESHITRLLSSFLNKSAAIFLFVLTLPIMAITVLAIYLDDGRKTKSSFLYSQTRLGKGGKPFKILKFRSMGKDAEKNGAQWAVVGDSRVTKIGKFLRKYRIDELPQLINVIKGEMNFVGPRPERPEFYETLAPKIPFFSLRSKVTPGLTGWAQLQYPYGASDKDSLEKLKFDLYYIKHKSILFDVFIMIRTVEIVLFGRGR